MADGKTLEPDRRRIRLQFHYEVDALGERLVIWTEELAEDAIIARDRCERERYLHL